ncbi:MAG: helix-hairpin-helix domain-containing protein, partial [Calditrichia bacterium]|nr:helix-hairpin-helix domain-containing protein [Calditrichia bacterium]
KKFYTKPRKKEQLSLSSININTATEMELQKLPGIGPTMSKRIIEYRNRIGKFNKINDLINVKGIGKKTLDKLKPYLIIN